MWETQIRIKLWVCLFRLFADWDGWIFCCGLETSQRWGSELLSLVRRGNLLFPFHCWYPRQYKCAGCDLVKAFSLSSGFAFQLSGFHLFTLEPGFKGYDGKDNWSREQSSCQQGKKKGFNIKHFNLLRIPMGMNGTLGYKAEIILSISLSLSLLIPPLQQVSYHTQYHCKQISIDVSTPRCDGLQEFLRPDLCC